MITKTCEDCGREFKKLGLHLSKSECDRPEMTGRMEDIVTGSLMGDGSICRTNGANPYLNVTSINKEYLEYLQKNLGIFSGEIHLSRSAKQSAKENLENGFDPNASEENYSDVYYLQTMRSPAFNKFASWYSSGEKKFPKNIELNPIVLKNWYCCDGTLNTSNNPRMVITCKNEIDNMNKLIQYFRNSGLPEPKHYNYGSLTFNYKKSKEMFDYMGKPLPGFEYKWGEFL